MNTIKEKVEAYVRSQIPELMEPRAGCRLVCKGDAWWEHGIMIRGDKLSNLTTGKIEERDDSWEIIGHPIQLQHWLRMLRIGHKDAEITWSVVNSKVLYLSKDCWKNVISFEDGQPATEADYQTIAEILNIEV